jgi:hypothetical protein
MKEILWFLIGILFGGLIAVWFIRYMIKDGYLIFEITEKFRKEIMGEEEILDLSAKIGRSIIVYVDGKMVKDVFRQPPLNYFVSPWGIDALERDYRIESWDGCILKLVKKTEDDKNSD